MDRVEQAAIERMDAEIESMEAMPDEEADLVD